MRSTLSGGLWPWLALAAYAVFHLVRLWPALQGRDAWIERTQALRPGALASGLLVSLIVLHAVGQVRSYLAQRRARAQGARPDSLQGFLALTSVLLVAFLAVHLWALWPPELGPHASWADAYDHLWAELGAPLLLAIYVTGVSALVFHVGTGLSRALASRLPSLPVGALRLSLGAAAALVWIGYLQVVARFALGESLLPWLFGSG